MAAENKKAGADGSGSFAEFIRVALDINAQPSYTGKTEILSRFFKEFPGDLYLFCKLMLCRNDKRVYNVRDKQIVKILSRVFHGPLQDMTTDLEKGEMPETAKKFWVSHGKPAKKSTLTLKQVDAFLDELTQVSREEEQEKIFSPLVAKCTGDDLKWLCKIIDHDLKINIGPKFVLGAIHPDAFEAFKNSNDLKQVLKRVESFNKKAGDGEDGGSPAKLQKGVQLMTPIKPMLARATKSLEEAVRRCPHGMYSEIKYDGERVQIHKSGSTFNCFSRNLKTVLPHKVTDIKAYLPKATDASSIILDGEILLMDTATHRPLPFGTLGVHKKTGFKDATVCVFLFDILYLNGESLLHLPIRKRREILEKNVKVIRNHIEVSEQYRLTKLEEITKLMNRALKEGLEGLVVKDADSIYEPDARHWLKIKKDYLVGMADSADLVVIGAYFGSGNKGGLLSVFLMGTYDPAAKKWKTVCKVGNGHDDATLARLQPELIPKMTKVSQDYDRLPPWIVCSRMLVPDYVMTDPKKGPVWEIAGSEFSKSPNHSADGISIRFPRVVKIRDDKDYTNHTNINELKKLVAASKGGLSNAGEDDEEDNGDDLGQNSPYASPPPSPKASKPAPAAAQVPAAAQRSKETEEKKEKEKEKEQKKRAFEDNDDEAVTMRDVSPKGDVAVPHVQGDVTNPMVGDPLETAFILHCCDTSGKWPNKGVFGAISARWSEPEASFAESAKRNENIALGDYQLVKVPNSNAGGKLYVCNLIVQRGGQGGIPPFDHAAFDEALQKLSGIALHKKASIHFAKPNPGTPGLDGDKLERSIAKWLARRGITVLIYTKSSGGQAPPPAAAGAPKAAVEKKPFVGKGKRAASDGNDTEEIEEGDGHHQPSKVQRKEQPKQQEEKPDGPTTPAAPKDDPDGTQPLSDSEQPPRSYDPENLPDLPPLDGVVLVLDKSVSAADAEAVRAAATSLGAGYESAREPNSEIFSVAPKWMPRGQHPTTHLVASRGGSDVVQHVERLGGWVLKPEWILQCKVQNKRLEEEPFTHSANAAEEKPSAAPAAAAPVTAPAPTAAKAELADVFTSVKLHFVKLPKNVLDPVKRYFIAHNGDLASSAQDATHVVTEPPWTPELDSILKNNPRVKIVIPDWVIESVKAKKLLPEKPYFVERKPANK